MTPIDWLMSNDTGTSSKVICAVMTGSARPQWPDVPSDAGDFGRCYRLLKHFPEWMPRLNEVAEQYPAWRPMIEAWTELASLYEQFSDEQGRFIRGKAYDRASKQFHARLSYLISAGRIADGWTQNPKGAWSKGTTGMIVEIGKGVTIKTGADK